MKNMPWLLKVPLFVLFAVLSQGHAVNMKFDRNGKVDCVVSDSWSAWEGPNGFGGYERYRSIITQPKNGGRPCPTDLVQTRPGPKPTVEQVAQTVENNFLRRRSRNNQRDDLFKRSSPDYMSRDLLVILDSSGSIGPDTFTEVKNDIAELLGFLCPADASNDPFKSSDISYHQAAFLQYSSFVREEFDFGDNHPTSALQSAIRNISFIGSTTATDWAFHHAIVMFQSNRRGLRNNEFVQKEVLILTDGQSNCKSCSIQAAMDLKSRTYGPNDDEVKVYGLIVGNFTSEDQDEVKQYVSHPSGQHLFASDDFDQLPALLQEIKEGIANYPCIHFSIG